MEEKVADRASFFPQEILDALPPYKTGVILKNPDDPRYNQVSTFRARIGETLHRAANVLRDAGESDNSVEAVKLLVTTIGTLLTAYGIRSKQFGNAQNAYAGMLVTKKLYESQRKHHRSIFMAAASVHHQNRLTTLAYYRVRSELDDKLIGNMLDFCLSPFVRVRRSAQGLLETIAKIYRGTWVLCFPKLFDALQPGTDPDRMKGALYVLRYNLIGIARISKDWRHTVQLAECLLHAHHETKASIQTQISKAMEELISAIRDPSHFNPDFGTQGLDTAADAVCTVIKNRPDTALVLRLRQAIVDFRAEVDVQHDRFVSRVLEIVSDESLNWRYSLWASRLLGRVVRRDGPADVRLTRFFAWNVLNPHPRLRDHAAT